MGKQNLQECNKSAIVLLTLDSCLKRMNV